MSRSSHSQAFSIIEERKEVGNALVTRKLGLRFDVQRLFILDDLITTGLHPLPTLRIREHYQGLRDRSWRIFIRRSHYHGPSPTAHSAHTRTLSGTERPKLANLYKTISLPRAFTHCPLCAYENIIRD
ncbi:hypothetical protein RRG08_007386 [Elysia crispata]|uniref:Uncharacterized protein n=1 Tax=Elysia crispata TaxID=231223 RepID=A0AAE1AS33_9GAST|nr:hypothetical protein RRG08_007386 [Elysia crispata]